MWNSLILARILFILSVQVWVIVWAIVVPKFMPSILALSVYWTPPSSWFVFHLPMGRPVDFSQLMLAPVACVYNLIMRCSVLMSCLFCITTVTASAYAMQAFDPSTVQPVVSHYTDYAFPALTRSENARKSHSRS